MFKDIIETVIKELQNEKTQEHIDSVLGPFLYRIKSSFYLTIILLIIIIANLVYSNILLTEMTKVTKI